MPQRLRLFAALLVLAATTALGASPLTWETTDVRIEAPPLSESVEAVFPFTNTGARAVTIAEVHSSCGCTVPQLEKRIYEPGESGVIRATFTLGERMGLQEKTVIVSTSAPDAGQTILTLRVQIPKLFETARSFVVWNAGEPAKPQVIPLTILMPELLTLATVESRHASFEASVAPDPEAPGRHLITITPRTTEKETNGAVIATLRTPDGRSRAVTFYALIRSAPTKAASSARPAPAP